MTIEIQSVFSSNYLLPKLLPSAKISVGISQQLVEMALKYLEIKFIVCWTL